MCLSPINLKKKSARLTYSQTSTNVVPCGRCAHCLRKRVNDWAFRMLQELKQSKSAVFLTLTYDNDNLPIDLFTNMYIDYETGEITEYTYPQPYLKKDDFQLFMKRLRKSVPKIKYIKKNGKTGYKSDIKYYACGEYGNNNTKRPHYHAVVFNLPMEYLQKYSIIHNLWSHGIVHFGDCNIATIKYVCKYINKRINKKNTDKPQEFSLMSKNIGLNFLSTSIKNYYSINTFGYATMPDGYKQALPRYYKDKLFNEMELHVIKLQSIDSDNERFKQIFNNNYLKLNLWKQDEIRKSEKMNFLNRNKL